MESNPEMDALREEAGGYQTAMPGMGFETGPEPGPGSAACPVDDTLIAYVYGLIFNRLAATRGAHWALTPEEEKHLVVISKPLIAKYFPAAMNKYGAEIAFVAGAGMIVAGKIMKEPNEGVRKEA